MDNDKGPGGMTNDSASGMKTVAYGFFSGHGNHFRETVSAELKDLAHGGNFIWAPLVRRTDAERLIAEKESEVQRLRRLLARVVDTDWAYLGRDADTGNPDSLYNRVRDGRKVLGKT